MRQAWLPAEYRQPKYAACKRKKYELRSFEAWMEEGVEFDFISFDKRIGSATIQRYESTACTSL